ncbi:MAG TPA: hypothetical protein VFV87_23075 [Pirellulaceae bacterium]|nr:hypothetical protein [Pirellulaceae bacterium]
MKTLFNWLGTLLVAFSIGTVLSLAVLLGMLWWKGALTDDRLVGMIAALQGIKPVPPASSTPNAAEAEQPSLDQIMQGRLRASLDLDLRESAIDKSLGDLRAVETQIKAERERLDLWKVDFDARLAKLENAATDAAILEVQRTLESMQPKQAKDQILKMLDEPATNIDDPMRDVVTVLKSMADDKRKKLLAEFKTPEEAERLAEIIREVRLGLPDSEVIRDTRNQLQQQLNPQR